MANVTFTATGQRGHIGYYDLSARSTVTLDLINASYNSVKVFPALLYVQNGGNNSGISITDDAGITQTIQAHVNHVIDINGQRQLRIANAGQVTCRLIVIDKYAAAGSYANLALSSDVDAISINDLLLHFDTQPDSSSNMRVNSGATIFSNNSSAGVVQDGSTIKFGIRSARFPATMDYLWYSNASFFDMSKNFTLDFWARITGTTGNGYLVSITNDPAIVPPIIFVSLPGGIGGAVRLSINGAVYDSAVGLLTTGQYNFLRLIKSSQEWVLYINGALAVKAYSTYSAALGYILFSTITTVNSGFSGYLDEARYSKGFVPDNAVEVPSEPYI